MQQKIIEIIQRFETVVDNLQSHTVNIKASHGQAGIAKPLSKTTFYCWAVLKG